jgi:hypothetical protein
VQHFWENTRSRLRFAIYGTLALVLLTAAALPEGVSAKPQERRLAACVPTEPMPIAGLGAKDSSRMPVLRSKVVPFMPTVRLVPCYLRDTLAALERR